jgi:N-acetylmuramoyl-L-alanine amidase
MVLQSFKSPNFELRANNQLPSMIVLHYTGMQSEEEALIRLCNPDSKVSSHYFVGENGDVLHLVDPSKRAWHAGLSYWDGEKDINSQSIGIEIANPGHEFGYREFPALQIASVTRLCSNLSARYKIKPWNVLGHSDVAPKRKQDPGELFPWRNLALHGVGIWPKPQEKEISKAKKFTSRDEFLKLLVLYGYNPEIPYDRLVVAFHRHFCPEKFGKTDNPDMPDHTSAARLLALLRMKGKL